MSDALEQSIREIITLAYLEGGHRGWQGAQHGMTRADVDDATVAYVEAVFPNAWAELKAAAIVDQEDADDLDDEGSEADRELTRTNYLARKSTCFIEALRGYDVAPGELLLVLGLTLYRHVDDPAMLSELFTLVGVALGEKIKHETAEGERA